MNKLKFVAAIAAVAAVAACNNPMSQDDWSSSKSGARSALSVTSFFVKLKGDGTVVNSSTEIRPPSGDYKSGEIKTTISGAVANYGQADMTFVLQPNDNPLDPLTYRTNIGPRSLIPYITATDSFFLPLSDYWLRCAFTDDTVYGIAMSWAQQLKTAPVIANGPDQGEFFMTLVKQQNNSGHGYFNIPLQEWALPVDFTAATDVIVMNHAGKATHYKVSLTEYTSIPIYVNPQTGIDDNTGDSWPMAKKTLKAALEAPNPNSDPSQAKVIYLAGSQGVTTDYDIEGFIANDGDPVVPAVGGIKIVGGFRGVESTQGGPRDALSNPALYPVRVTNSANIDTATLPIPITGAGERVLVVRGVPFAIENLTLFSSGPGVVVVGKGTQTNAKGSFTVGPGAIVTGGTVGSGNGGGVLVVEDSILNIEGGDIAGNSAALGGGVYTDYGTINFNSGRVIGNTANDGGGIYLTGQPTTPVPGSTTAGRCYFSAGAICGNFAQGSSGNGGGVYVTTTGGGTNQRGEFFMGYGSSRLAAGQKPEIYGNVALNLGGGIYWKSQSGSGPVPVVSKVGDAVSGGNASSGYIEAITDGFPPMPVSPATWATTVVSSRSNIAWGGAAPSGIYPPSYTPPAVGGAGTPGDTHGHAIYDGDDSLPLSQSLGGASTYDSANPNGAAGNANGNFKNIKLEVNVDRVGWSSPFNTTDMRYSYIKSDSSDPANYKPGKITFYVPAEAIDNYTDASGIVRNNVAKLSLEIEDASGILLQAPADTSYYTGSPMATHLFPSKYSLVANYVQTEMSRIRGAVPANWALTPEEVAKNLQDLLKGAIAAETGFNPSNAQTAFTTARGGTPNSATLIECGPDYTPPAASAMLKPNPVDFGLMPWYIVIDSAKTPHVYWTEIIITDSAVVFVDENTPVSPGARTTLGTANKWDGTSWLTAYGNLGTALTKIADGQPTEVWVRGKSGAHTNVAVPRNKNVTIYGGFYGGEATKKKREDSSGVIATNVELQFTNTAANVMGMAAKLRLENVRVTGTNPLVCDNGYNDIVLGTGTVMNVPVRSIKPAVNVRLLDGSKLVGTTANTGISLSGTGGSVSLSGNAEISGWGTGTAAGGGGVYLKNGTMSMSDNSSIKGNNLFITGNKPDRSSAMAAGITLIGSSLTLYATNSTTLTPPQISGNKTTTSFTTTDTAISAGTGYAVQGGGIYAYNSQIVFTANTAGRGAQIINNTAGTPSNGGSGGGIYLDENSQLIFNQGQINGNKADGDNAHTKTGNGGGVFLGGQAAVSEANFVNLTGTGSGNRPIPAYNNGVILDMTGAAAIIPSTGANTLLSNATTTDTDKSAVIGGNSARRGGGVYLSKSALLKKYGGTVDTTTFSLAVNNKGAIIGINDGSPVNDANRGAALYDENSLKIQTTGLYMKYVDNTIWANAPSTNTAVNFGANGDYGNYPPDANGVGTPAADTGYINSTYRPANAMNRDNRLNSFSLKDPSSNQEYPGAVKNDEGRAALTPSTYYHAGEASYDPYGAAWGEITMDILLDDVRANKNASDANKGFIIQAQTTGTNAKILLPDYMYDYARITAPPWIPQVGYATKTGDFTQAVRTLFNANTLINGSIGTWNATSVPNTAKSMWQAITSPGSTQNVWDQGGNPGAVDIALGSMREKGAFNNAAQYFNSLNAEYKFNSMILIQMQTSNPANNMSQFSKAGANANYTYNGVDKAVLYYPRPADGVLTKTGTPEVPRITFDDEAKLNMFDIYVLSQSGNVRRYVVKVNVYTAAPKYVVRDETVQADSKWGYKNTVKLLDATTAAASATSSVDIWVKSRLNTSDAVNNGQPLPSHVFGGGVPISITGGFVGTETTPEDRPRQSGKMFIAHTYDGSSTPSYTAATYRSPGDGTVRTYTKGPNYTLINLGDIQVDPDTSLIFRDINVNFGANKLIINGGTVLLENAHLEFSSGRIIIENSGKLTIQDADKATTMRESRILFTGNGYIQVGTRTAEGIMGPQGNTSAPGMGFLNIYSGRIETQTGSNLASGVDGLIIAGDYSEGTNAVPEAYKMGYVTLGAPSSSARYDIGSGAIWHYKTGTASLQKPLVFVNPESEFTINSGDNSINAVGPNLTSETPGSVHASLVGVYVRGIKQRNGTAASYSSHTARGGKFTMLGGEIKGFATGSVNTTNAGVKLEVHSVMEKTSGTIHGRSGVLAVGNKVGNNYSIIDGTLEGMATGFVAPIDKPAYETTTVGGSATNAVANWDQHFSTSSNFSVQAKQKFAVLAQHTPDPAEAGSRYIYVEISGMVTGEPDNKFMSGTIQPVNLSPIGAAGTSPFSTSTAEALVFGQNGLKVNGDSTVLDNQTMAAQKDIGIVIPVNQDMTANNKINFVIKGSAFVTQNFAATIASATTTTYALFTTVTTTNSATDSWIRIPPPATGVVTYSTFAGANFNIKGQGAGYNAGPNSKLLNSTELALLSNAFIKAPIYVLIKKAAVSSTLPASITAPTPTTWAGFSYLDVPTAVTALTNTPTATHGTTGIVDSALTSNIASGLFIVYPAGSDGGLTAKIANGAWKYNSNTYIEAQSALANEPVQAGQYGLYWQSGVITTPPTSVATNSGIITNLP